jgi:sugar O-acyltransferase (sialic acid O-acetyltransferase NeuD family)
MTENQDRTLPERIVILGGIGSGVIVASAVRACAAAGSRIAVLGFLNDAAEHGSALAGIPVLGRFEQWTECPPDVAFISAIPQAKEAWPRFRRIAALGIPAGRWATVIHPTACVDDSAVLGPGSFVGPLAVIDPAVHAGAHACLRGGCYVSHDVTCGDYVFVGPNATVLSRCVLGEGAHIGSNAVCVPRTSVGRYAVVGVGAAVVRDVAEFAIVAGNPAREIGQISPN